MRYGRLRSRNGALAGATITAVGLSVVCVTAMADPAGGEARTGGATHTPGAAPAPPDVFNAPMVTEPGEHGVLARSGGGCGDCTDAVYNNGDANLDAPVGFFNGNGLHSPFDRFVLDDFVVPECGWIVEGFHLLHVWEGDPPGSPAIQIDILHDDNGVPGDPCGECSIFQDGYTEAPTGRVVLGRTEYEGSLCLALPLDLEPGRYWFRAAVVNNNFSDQYSLWLTTAGEQGSEAWIQYEDFGGVLRPGSDFYGQPYDLAWCLTGQPGPKGCGPCNDAIYDNGDADLDATVGFFNGSRPYSQFDREVLDDFEVSGCGWELQAFHFLHVWEDAPPGGPSFQIALFHDDNGAPGDACGAECQIGQGSYEEVPTGRVILGRPEYRGSWVLSAPASLDPGRYWFQAFVVDNIDDPDQYSLWLPTAGQRGTEAWIEYEDFGGMRRPGSDFYGQPYDLAWCLTGQPIPGDLDIMWSSLGGGGGLSIGGEFAVEGTIGQPEAVWSSSGDCPANADTLEVGGGFWFGPLDSCPEDFNRNGVVDFADILAVLGAWGSADGLIDLDGSGAVDFADLLVLLSAWGPC